MKKNVLPVESKSVRIQIRSHASFFYLSRKSRPLTELIFLFKSGK